MVKHKLSMYLAHLFQFLVIFTIAYSFYFGDYVYGLAGIFGLIITFIPALLTRAYKLTLPWELNFLIILALFLEIAGGVFGWYDRFDQFYYDKITHLVSFGTIAVFGMISVIILDVYTEIKLNRPMIFFLIIIFTLAMGVIWEFFEFGIDFYCERGVACGVIQQKNNLDTMTDLFADFFGGIIAAIVGDFYLKHAPREKFIQTYLND